MHTERLKITGMSCGDCSTKVAQALKAVAGVADVNVSLGLGDMFPSGHLRLISAIEALNGLILIGWSTSFTFLAMRRYWPLESHSAAVVPARSTSTGAMEGAEGTCAALEAAG